MTNLLTLLVSGANDANVVSLSPLLKISCLLSLWILFEDTNTLRFWLKSWTVFPEK